MKKILVILLLLVSFTVFSCLVLSTPSTILYLLNWGEYIDSELIKKFEQEYHCQVVEENVTSSEAMYQKISSETTSYDVAIPGDYTVRQLYKEGMLKELDTSNPELEFIGQYKTMYTDSLRDLIEQNMLNEEGRVIDTYFMPYFWGAYSIIYSTRKDDVESVIKTNGFKALYDRSLYNEEVSIGMYDTARWIVVSYLLAQDKDANITSYDGSVDNDLSDEIARDVENALKTTRFNEFGNDQLKRNVANGTLDMCYVQLGDFFDALYLVYDESNSETVIDFNVAVPSNAAAFFDSMIIPTTCQNYDLANKFINFMLNPENAYQNAQAIGYCPTLKSVCNLYHEAAENNEYYYQNEDNGVELTMQEFLDKYPMYLDPLYNSKKAVLLEPKSNEYLTTCETIFNRLA